MLFEKYSYMNKPVDAIQFKYIDGNDGPKTTELANKLGLKRSKNFPDFWEVQTYLGWKKISNEDWIIKDENGIVCILRNKEFDKVYKKI